MIVSDSDRQSMYKLIDCLFIFFDETKFAKARLRVNFSVPRTSFVLRVDTRQIHQPPRTAFRQRGTAYGGHAHMHACSSLSLVRAAGPTHRDPPPEVSLRSFV